VILKKHIYLSGFMGVGKTRIGRELAKKLGVRFIDTDAWIESSQNTRIAEIFKNQGEAYFRELETQTLTELSRHQPSVISLGGGTILRAVNREILKKGHWFFLHRPLAIIQKNLKFNAKRPLLNEHNWRDLYRNREPLYRLATHTLYCGSYSFEVIAQNIHNRIKA